MCDPLIFATKPAAKDSKVSTETHCPGLVVSFNLLLPFFFLQGFLVALLYAHVGPKRTSVEFKLFGNFPCNALNLILGNDR